MNLFKSADYCPAVKEALVALALSDGEKT